MRRKWTVILSVLLILFVWVNYLQQPVSDKTTLNEVQNINNDDLKSTGDFNQSEQRVKTEHAEKTEEPMDLSAQSEINGIPMSQLLAEIKNPKYSDDPMLEVTSLQAGFEVCRYPWLGRISKKAKQTSKLRPFEQQVKNKCEAFAKQYPLLFKTSSKYGNLLNFPADSLVGKRYKYLLAGLLGKHNDYDYEQSLIELFELSLQIKSPSLISFNALATGVGLSATENQTEFFKELLQTDINIWVFEAHNLATQALSCDLPHSNSCDATSYYMVYICDRQPAACGLSFQQWFKKYTTPGMKKDVAIIKDYYQAKYW